MIRRCWLFAALLSAPAMAQEHAALEAGVGFDALSGRYDNWQSSYLQYENNLSADTLGYLRYNYTRRFELSDSELLAGVYTGLDDDWSLFAEVGGSGTAAVRPELQAQTLLSRKLTDGYIASLGLHRSHWANSTSQGVSLQLERYFGRWRWDYRIRRDHLLGGDNALSHTFSLSRYYDGWSSISLVLSRGEEAEKISPQQVLVTDVKGITVHGLHQLNNDWGMRWALSWNEQGDYYDRQGVLLGLRYRF